jgi:HD-GYP domain-containing protein (c-di-GMP phosphodiesterase class II)
MKLVPLSEVSQTLHAGVTLPWGVRDANGSLLLAKGHVISDDRALSALLERGVFVDATEAAAAANKSDAPKENLSGRWSALETKLGAILRSPTEQHFLQRVSESIHSISGFADGNVDLLIFLIMRHDHTRLTNYGIAHSLHAAAMCSLLSRRLGWPEARRQTAIGAALTMNISILELQGQLANRGGRPTAAERILIDEHPTASAKLLQTAGLGDAEWIEAVQQHHEEMGGTGYPNKVQQPNEIARLVHFVDSFTAKHSPRAGRKPQPAQKAARDLFTQSYGDPLAALVIKEFGIYPPGCYVKLASGEMAIVTQRGATANAPIVAAITNKNGDQLSIPARRDTSAAGHSIISTVPEQSVMVRVNVDSLYDRSANM